MCSEGDSLAGRVDQMSTALTAISALIEAAPFPIWHRRGDGVLTLVNSAYVSAVVAPSAAEAVARGAELFDDSRGMAPREAAVQAKADNRPLVRTAPAIVAGDRKSP